MSFPNAAKGIKKIYRAEILKLISYICLFFAAVTGAIAFLSSSDDVTSASSEALSMGGFIRRGVWHFDDHCVHHESGRLFQRAE